MDRLQEMADGKDIATKVLEKYLANDKATEKDHKKARVAASYMSNQIRVHTAVTQREKAKFMLAKLLNGSEDQMKKYLKLSTPKASLTGK